MSSQWSKQFWADLGERVAATFIATLIPLYVATENAFRLDWTTDLEIAASAAGLSLLKGLAANLAHPDSGPSLLPAPPAPEIDPASDGGDTPDAAARADKAAPATVVRRAAGSEADAVLVDRLTDYVSTGHVAGLKAAARGWIESRKDT